MLAFGLSLKGGCYDMPPSINDDRIPTRTRVML